MENRKSLLRLVGIILLIALIVGGIVGFVNYKLSTSTINISEDDFNNMVEALSPYLLVGGGLILLVIISFIISRRASDNIRKLVTIQSIVAIILIAAIVGNLIIFGPANKILSLTLGEKYIISDQTIEESKDLGVRIAEEGIVLLKNEDEVLPIKNGSSPKINVFGWSSTNPIYGGTGSGAVDTSDCITLLGSLKDAGFNVNSQIIDFYESYKAERPMVGMWGQDWTVPEPTVKEYKSAGIFDNAENFSDTALIVISRSGGEGADLPTSITDQDTFQAGGMFGASGVRYTSNPDDIAPGKHYLELSNREVEMVENVTSRFNNVVVIINSANPMELGWLDDYENIKSALLVPGPGETGFAAVGQILNGTVNPSGKLPDTYVYDLLDTPTANNYGNFTYDNMANVVNAKGADTNYQVHFVNYVEGIYLGYKFYETAAAEGLIDYDSEVQYPFGYGLSYTSFNQEITDFEDDGNTITVDVAVTNTGDTAGKEVVEVYYTPPYYNGGIEKAEVNLISFAKTKKLNPGQTETLALTFDHEDMASYDYENNECYLLEKGDYKISIRSDSHTVLDSRSITIDNDVIYNSENEGARSDDMVVAENQFDHAHGDVTYLSRADNFANYEEATAAPTDYSMSEESKSSFLSLATYDLEKDNNSSDRLPVTGADNGLGIRDLAGVDYDNSKWDKLLDQLTVDEMSKLIALGGYSTAAVDSINLPQTVNCDGPAAINNNFSGLSGTAFPSAVLLASSWNKDIAEDFGSQIGQEAKEMHVSGWYAPAMNIHRSAFLGRSFEYYSEDGFLSGVIAGKTVKGAREHKITTYMKHFALNDQETNRLNMLATWATEQTIREIYLKPFEMSVKEGGATGAMSAFNYIGTHWAGASSALLQDVLRDEWGFNGIVITDYYLGNESTGFMDADIAIRNGNDLMLSTTGTGGAYVDDTSSATGVSAMRKATHNILYSVATSNAMTPEYFKMESWVKVVIGINIVLGLIIIAIEVVYFLRRRKRDNENIVV